MSAPGPDEGAEWHRVAEERRRQLERLQDQTLYRVAAGAIARGRRALRTAQRVTDPVRDTAVRLGRSVLAAPERMRSAARYRALQDAVAGLPAAPGGAARRREVTAVVVTASQPARLDVLLTALGRIGVATVVVDNAGVPENAHVIARHPDVRHLRLERPLNYAAANEAAIAEVTTAWTLLLNDDVVPLDDHWLDRMLEAADDATVAVGALLVHGRRGLLGGDAVDVTVQHAGIGFMLDGPLARPAHLDRGARPRANDTTRDVVASTAACLLVRTDAHRAVGGLHPGFDYGSEDVDLCLRLSGRGRLRVALGAVLEHEEGATRLSGRGGVDRRVRTARQAANRALLDARHGPLLRRRIVDAVLGADPHDERATVEGLTVAIATSGRAPALLRQVVATRAGVSLTSGAVGALVVATDPRELAGRAGHGDVPVVAWLEDGDAGPSWSAADLARVDAVLVVGPARDGAPRDGASWDAGAPAPAVGAEPTPALHRATDADGVLRALRSVLLAPRWSVRTGAPGGRAAARWGDTPVAEALARELRAHGIVVRVIGRDGWGSAPDRGADVTLHLKGRGVAPTADAQTNVVWVMSHPSEVAPGELDDADLVLAGSEPLADRYRGLTATPVAVLPQAADARRFVVGPRDPEVACRVLFVGNTRSVARPAVLGAVDAGLPLTLVGGGWERYLDPGLVARDQVANDELPSWYRSADVVLNDHWEDMARWGLVSNRVFDVLACGGCVVSDEVPGMDVLLDDAVITFAGRDDVGPVVRAALADPVGRAERVERGRRAVLDAHTWEHRAAQLVALVAEHGR